MATAAPCLPFHRKLGDGLQIQIERQLQPLPGFGFLGPDYLALIAAAIHHHLALAVHAHQHVVVLALDAELPDHVARMVVGVLSGSSSSASLISPVYPMMCAAKPFCGYRRRCGLKEFQLGVEFRIAVRLHECQIFGRKILFDHDRNVQWLLAGSGPASLRDRPGLDSARRRSRADVRLSDFRAPTAATRSDGYRQSRGRRDRESCRGARRLASP